MPLVQQPTTLQPPSPFGPPAGGPPSLASVLPPQYQQALGIAPSVAHVAVSAPAAPAPSPKPTASAVPSIAPPGQPPRGLTLPPISPRVLQAQQSEDSLRAQGGPQYTGKLGVLQKIGDTAARLFAPGIEQRLGIGTVGYQQKLAQADAATQEAEKEAASDAGAEKTGSDAQLATANANHIANEPAPQVAPDVQAFDTLVKGGVDPVEAYRQVTQAGIKTPPRALEHVTLTGPDGKPMAANYNAETGQYTDVSGAPIQNPTPYSASRTAVNHYATATGTADGKPAVALFNSATGQYLGTDMKPLAGFQPSANKPMSPIEGAMLLRSLLSEGMRANPQLLQAAAHIAQASGLGFTPADIAAIAQVPVGQPENESGQPIGLSQPGAPTTATRAQGQTAQRVLAELPRIRNEVSSLSPDLGPLAGRWNQFMTGEVGSGGADGEKYAQLRGDINFLTSAAAKFHLNSVRAVQEFNKLADTGKMTKQVLDGFIDAVEPWAVTAARQGDGLPASPVAPSSGYKAGDTRAYNGATYVFKGGDPTLQANWEKR